MSVISSWRWSHYFGDFTHEFVPSPSIWCATSDVFSCMELPGGGQAPLRPTLQVCSTALQKSHRIKTKPSSESTGWDLGVFPPSAAHFGKFRFLCIIVSAPMYSLPSLEMHCFSLELRCAAQLTVFHWVFVWVGDFVVVFLERRCYWNMKHAIY